MTWLNSKQIKKQFGICNQTIYNWRKENKIIFKKINDRNFLYDIDSILNTKNEKRENVIYCRVSNTKQNQDLIKQEQIIKEYMIKNGIKVDANGSLNILRKVAGDKFLASRGFVVNPVKISCGFTKSLVEFL